MQPRTPNKNEASRKQKSGQSRPTCKHINPHRKSPPSIVNTRPRHYARAKGSRDTLTARPFIPGKIRSIKIQLPLKSATEANNFSEQSEGAAFPIRPGITIHACARNATFFKIKSFITFLTGSPHPLCPHPLKRHSTRGPQECPRISPSNTAAIVGTLPFSAWLFCNRKQSQSWTSLRRRARRLEL